LIFWCIEEETNQEKNNNKSIITTTQKKNKLSKPLFFFCVCEIKFFFSFFVFVKSVRSRDAKLERAGFQVDQ